MSSRAKQLQALCRDEGIAVTLLLTPEGTEFHGWYGPATEATLVSYLGQLSRETGVPVVDARGWLADDVFYDSHHVVEPGARDFTRRLDAEVLRPALGDELGANWGANWRANSYATRETGPGDRPCRENS